MMTFAAAANAAQKKKKTRSICKWSGDCDADDEYYWRGGGDDDDEDTGTITADERRYYKWYLAQSRVQWRDDDVDDSRRPVAAAPAAPAANKKTIAHVPFMNLTAAERAKKSKQFKFGLCSDCDVGLCNESDFVCKPRPNGTAPLMTCNACTEYYLSLSYMRVEEQKERGGCN
jgi:hypothetical protein